MAEATTVLVAAAEATAGTEGAEAIDGGVAAATEFEAAEATAAIALEAERSL